MTVYPLTLIRLDADLKPLASIIGFNSYYVQPLNSSQLLVINKMPTGKKLMLLELYVGMIRATVDYDRV
jgi:hypothetical protein